MFVADKRANTWKILNWAFFQPRWAFNHQPSECAWFWSKANWYRLSQEWIAEIMNWTLYDPAMKLVKFAFFGSRNILSTINNMISSRNSHCGSKPLITGSGPNFSDCYESNCWQARNVLSQIKDWKITTITASVIQTVTGMYSIVTRWLSKLKKFILCPVLILGWIASV